VLDAKILHLIDDLQLRYALALDRRNMQAWLDCFTDDGSYVCIARENDDENLPLALMMDDCRDRLVDRVNYVEQVWAGTFEDYTTRHFVQRMESVADNGIYRVSSNVMVSYTSAKGFSELLVAGAYEDEIAITGDTAKFKSKRAVIDTLVTPRYIVYPI
jgi:3-phenylpropionate/cinnamic acid dioxygenase small subunit